MKLLTVVAFICLGSFGAKADGLFMGANWAAGGGSQATAPPASRDRQVRSEDTDGVRTRKIVAVSVQAYAPRYLGPKVNDGICDQLQPRSYDTDGYFAYKNSLPVTTLYRTVGSCEPTYYPGFYFIGGQPNMALAPHWNGQPDWAPAPFSYIDWLDPRYNPALRNGG